MLLTLIRCISYNVRPEPIHLHTANHCVSYSATKHGHSMTSSMHMRTSLVEQDYKKNVTTFEMSRDRKL